MRRRAGATVETTPFFPLLHHRRTTATENRLSPTSPPRRRRRRPLTWLVGRRSTGWTTVLRERDSSFARARRSSWAASPTECGPRWRTEEEDSGRVTGPANERRVHNCSIVLPVVCADLECRSTSWTRTTRTERERERRRGQTRIALSRPSPSSSFHRLRQRCSGRVPTPTSRSREPSAALQHSLSTQNAKHSNDLGDQRLSLSRFSLPFLLCCFSSSLPDQRRRRRKTDEVNH